jgi:CheY-like chemotaxis protein
LAQLGGIAVQARTGRRGPSGVLVVDDQEAIRDLLCLALPRYGLRVWVAGDGPTALALFERHREQINLALVDLHMPGMCGPEVAVALHEVAPELPCCLVSGNFEGAPPDLGGCCCLIAKPFSPAAIATACVACLRSTGRVSLDDSVAGEALFGDQTGGAHL